MRVLFFFLFFDVLTRYVVRELSVAGYSNGLFPARSETHAKELV